MPITDELGQALNAHLAGHVNFSLRPNQTFEDWLTLQVTPLPFLEGFENAKRAADAARVVGAIARVLDDRVLEASTAAGPLWLRQLIALWHVERAVVLTFNYDTLLERAVNSHPLTTTSPDGNVEYVLGDHVVFPAPPAPQAQFIGDSGPGHNSGSFQVLKLHGSLTWYWAAGDPTGSTLIRVREKHVFGTVDPLALETDFVGATSLDRYLIPPITSKDGYYGSYLANTLWRTARSFVSSASTMTLIGYSLPPEDRAASQLIAQIPEDVAVTVVDRNPGNSDSPPSGVLGNLEHLNLTSSLASSGSDCLPDFVANRLEKAIEELPNAHEFHELPEADADVVVAFSEGWPGLRSSLYVLAWNEAEQCFDPHRFDAISMRGSSSPYRERVLNTMPPGYRRPEDFVTAQRLWSLIDGGKPFTFKHPHTRALVVGIGAERFKIDPWEVLELKWAPYEK